MGHSIQWEHGVGATIRYTGRVTGDDLARVHKALTSDPRFDDLRYTINDFRSVLGHALDIDDPTALCETYASLIGAAHTNRDVHAAFLVRGADMARLVQRMITLDLFPYPARIFESEDAAHEWLTSVSGSYRRLELPR